MKHIAVFFITQRWDDHYSLTSVVKSQVRSLVNNGFKCKVMTNEGCSPWEFRSKVKYHPCIPRFQYDFDRTKINKQFYDQVDKAVERLAPYFEDVDVVLAHDAIFVRQFLPYNLLIRKIARRYPHIKWFHWCHSGPSNRVSFPYPKSLLFSSMPNAKIVTVSSEHRKKFAKMYSIALKDVLVIPNPRVNQDFLNFHPISWEIIKKGDLLSADIINVMATTLSREFKQPEICLFVLAALKKEGVSVRQVFINPSSERNFKEEANILFLKWIAKNIGLTEQEVVFTSHVNKRLTTGCPSIITRDLFMISNIFIHPSVGEACSLILLEAAITKHLCILNSDLRSFRELVGEHAIWVKFDYIMDNMVKKYKKTGELDDFRRYLTYYKTHERFYRSLARKILAALDRDPSQGAFSWVKSRFNEDVIYERYLKSILA